ncbi:hypothetical protein PPYR_07531 [Photinus pyralis]|uniref:Bifunctional lysine-specific demethylase and histidyl-hydroxylase n=1 Tax=Photinus pyralis TaxID=7054 RepID=A0A1Y1ND01_PHOPY|nr:ribosomal oxygenase 1 [Photinus pyralis]KAB0799651.1 hypothetical protein PPYR_07531 [Photinus pyralis]
MESAFEVYKKRFKQNGSDKTTMKKASSIKKKKDVIQKLKVNPKTKEFLMDYVQSSSRVLELQGSNEKPEAESTPLPQQPTVSANKVRKIKSKKKKAKLDDFSSQNIEHLINSSAESNSPNPSESPDKVFEWLISPILPREFFTTKWEKVPVHIKRNHENVYAELLSTKKLQSIFLDNVLFYTRNVDVVSYTNHQRETHNVEGRAVPAALWDYYKNGCSIRILNPHTYCSQLHSLLATLQEFFGCMVGVNAYLTPPGSQGFAPHYDDIEAFVLQLEGRKHWKLYAPLTPSKVLPRYSSQNFNRDELSNKPVRELTLEAGDLLYFPRGTIHEGFTDPETHSLHVTVSVYQKTSYVDLMEHVLKYTLSTAASDDVEFREGLPLQFLQHSGFANDDRDSEVRTTMKKKVKNLLMKMIDHLDIDSAADELGKQFMWDSMPPIPTKSEKERMMILNSEKMDNGKIYDKVDINLNVEVRLLRYHCMRLVKEAGEENLRIYYNTDNAKYYHGEEMQFLVIDYMYEDAVKCLIQTYPNYVQIGKLPLANDNDKIQIVSDLWEKGLIVTKTPLSYNGEEP